MDTKLIRNIPILSFSIICLMLLLLSGCISQNTDRITSNYFVTDDNIRLHYSDRGLGDEVLVAPMGFYLEPYLMDSLSKNRRVIMYDPRNRGRSQSAPLESVSLDRQVEDLEQLRQALNIKKMALLGWSALGLEMAVYTIRHPDRVTRLVQMSPMPPAASIKPRDDNTHQNTVDQKAIEALEARANAGEFRKTPAQHCRLYNRLTLPLYLVNTKYADEFVDVCQYQNEYRENLRPYFDALLSSYGDYDWRDDLVTLNTPRLVIHGREDRIPLIGANAWAAGYKNAQIVILSPSGHFPFIEQQEKTLAAIETFLAGEWPDNAQDGLASMIAKPEPSEFLDSRE